MVKVWKKILAVTLAVSMTMSMLSVTSLAAEAESESHLEGCGYQCTHVHEEECKKVETVESTDPADGYLPAVEAKEAVTCPNENCDGTEEGHVEPQDEVEGRQEVMGQKEVVTYDNCTHSCEAGGCPWVCAEGCPVNEAEVECEHDWGEGEVTQDSTCTDPGVKTFTCSKCGDTKTETISRKEHTLEIVEEIEATCTEPGRTRGEKCTECNTVFLQSTTTLPKGHTYEDGICTVCGEPEPEESAFTADFDVETGTLTINGAGELTPAIVDSFVFQFEDPGHGVVDWSLNGYNATSTYKQPRFLNNLVKKLVIGSGITVIGDQAFGGKGSSITGSTSASRALYYVTEIDLPDGLREIGKEAFYNCGVTAINFPASLERLGEMAFGQARNLTSLSIEAENLTIGSSAFWMCSKLETLTVDAAKEVGPYAFQECNKLKEVTLEKVTTIADNAFDGQISLESVTLKNVGKIGKNAFLGYKSVWNGFSNSYEYSKLSSLTIDGCTDIDERAFAYNYYLTDVSLKNVTGTIGKQAFYWGGYYSSNANVTLDNVKTIGQQAFQQAFNTTTNLTLNNIGTIGQYAFWYAYMESISMGKVTLVDQYAFSPSPNLTTVTMGEVGTIGPYAFMDCTKLTTIDSLANVNRIDGFAFYNCPNLTGLTVEDFTKMGFNGNYGDVSERVEAILSGRFKLDSAPGIVELTPAEGWDDSKVGKSDNWDTYEHGTQLVEQARWTNANKTEAEVKVDAYYTDKQQMDYIFVADLSASMAQLGNAKDQNSRFYDMQSKLLDMTGQLLNAEGYDCRVAIVTFGGDVKGNDATTTVKGFTGDATEAQAHINALEPYYENTDYGLGMKAALELAQNNTGRNTVVIFLSDGAPNKNGSGDQDGTANADQIKALNVPIYGVLHSPGNSHDAALEKMQAVCGENTVFESTDTESFGRAMNDAFTAVYGNHTVTIPVNQAFENVRELDLDVYAGEAGYDAGTHTITWTITGMPFTKHTLTYKMALTAENAAKYGEQEYPVNSGNASFSNDDGASVETPVLTRNVPQPYIPPVVNYYNLTINYVYADGTTAAPTFGPERHVSGWNYSVTSPVIDGYTADVTVVEGRLTQNTTVTVTYTPEEDVPETTPPQTESPEPTQSSEPTESPVPTESPEPVKPDEPGEETEDLENNDTPLAELPEEPAEEGEELDEGDVPLADVPQTGDMLWLWLALAALSAMGLACLTVSERKGKREA